MAPLTGAAPRAAALTFLGDVLDLDELGRLVAERRLRLQATLGETATGHVNGDPDALVAELLRLARIGMGVGRVAVDQPKRRVGGVVDEATADAAAWLKLIKLTFQA